jgi:hypothetical protein
MRVEIFKRRELFLAHGTVADRTLGRSCRVLALMTFEADAPLVCGGEGGALELFILHCVLSGCPCFCP